MTINDFSDGFDTLLSSYTHQAAFGEGSSMGDVVLDEFEKSQFLTKAQEDTVVSLYSGKNAFGDSFEGTEEQRRYLSNLVREDLMEPVEGGTYGIYGISDGSYFFTFPEDLWYITYESVEVDDADCPGMSHLDVFPVTQDEYHKVKRNPFRGTNDRRALRLDLSDGTIEVVSSHNVVRYYVRYLCRPEPIILLDLPEGLSINGRHVAHGCDLHEALHQNILERAVLLALQSRGHSAAPTTDNKK